MKNIVIFNEPVTSRLFKFYMGKGAKVDLRIASRPMIYFLRYLYHTQQEAISGDIEYLFSINPQDR